MLPTGASCVTRFVKRGLAGAHGLRTVTSTARHWQCDAGHGQRAQTAGSDVSPNQELQLTYLTEEDKQGIAVLGLNRPKARNSFSKSLVHHLLDAIEVLAHDKNVRVVILRSLVPGIFCAGADLKERATFTPQEVSRFVSKLRQMMVNIEQMPTPVVAAIDGAALGGGLEMALACDMRVVATNAKLGLVETKLGIIPGAGGTQRLPRILNPAVAKELIFTARQFSGEEAKALGIVNHAVQPNDAGDAAYQRALQLAMEIVPNGPVGVRMAKKAIDKGLQVDLGTGYAIEEACYAQVIPTKDRLEGLRAFAEKRKPNFIGE
uniref:Enoyl-CoA hydratase n=1 Tax=Anopheles melas TaxID=34690 RepID=A0A182TSI0_9DIPT